MKRKQARIYGVALLEPTSNNVIIRFKSSNLKRIHKLNLGDARKDYANMVNKQQKT